MAAGVGEQPCGGFATRVKGDGGLVCVHRTCPFSVAVVYRIDNGFPTQPCLTNPRLRAHFVLRGGRKGDGAVSDFGSFRFPSSVVKSSTG